MSGRLVTIEEVGRFSSKVLKKLKEEQFKTCPHCGEVYDTLSTEAARHNNGPRWSVVPWCSVKGKDNGQ